MSEQVQDHINQPQEPIQQARPPKKKRDVRGFINSPYLFLVVPLIVGGIFLVLHPEYITIAMNNPYAVAFILAIPVCWFLVKLVINFFSVIEKWIRLQFEKARHAKRGQFLEFVIAVFMFVSVTEGGPLFNKLQGYGLGGALGYITVFGFDLVAVVCMRSRAKMLRKGHDGKARIYQLGVWLCALVSVFANLYEAIQNASVLAKTNPLTGLAPLAGIAFPVMIIFLSYATDADEDDVDDPDVYKKEQEKLVKFTQTKREIAVQLLNEKIQMNLLKQREFFLRGWFFTKKKVNAVIEVCTEQVLAKIKADLDTLKQTFVTETTREVRAAHKAQIEKLEAQIAALQVRDSQVEELREEIIHHVSSVLSTLRNELVHDTQVDLSNMKAEMDTRFQSVFTLDSNRVSTLAKTVEDLQKTVQSLSLKMDSQVSSGGQQMDNIRSFVDAKSTRKLSSDASSVDSDLDKKQRIRELLKDDPELTGRAIAKLIPCSPTTANKLKAEIEEEAKIS